MLSKGTQVTEGQTLGDAKAAFDNWFGRSMVTTTGEPGGPPQVMYHGSSRVFEVFDRMASTQWRQPSMDTVGSWFTNMPARAEAYASKDKAVIYPVYLSITRPKVYDTFRDFLAEMHEAEGRDIRDQPTPGLGSTEGLRRRLKAQGYDGIAFTPTSVGELRSEIEEVRDAVQRARQEEHAAPRTERAVYTARRQRLEGTLARLSAELDAFGGSTEFDGHQVYVAFEPQQIKSAVGNNGQFDTRRPSIVEEPQPAQPYSSVSSEVPMERSDDAERQDAPAANMLSEAEPSIAAFAAAQASAVALNANIERFLRSQPEPAQEDPQGEFSGVGVQRARMTAAQALRDLAGQALSAPGLGRLLSSQLAAMQRVRLVGQVAQSDLDLATLAQLYRDPRFETFRLIFTNDRSEVVAQVGLTCRLPGSTNTIIGEDIYDFTKPLFKRAQAAGATGLWLLHNHPSGKPKPSREDLAVTREFAVSCLAAGLNPNGHVVVDTNCYSVIEPNGQYRICEHDFGGFLPYRQASEWSSIIIDSPRRVMELAKRLEVQGDAVSLIVLDSQHSVCGITSIPAVVTRDGGNKMRTEVLRHALRSYGSKVIAVTRDLDAAMRLRQVAMDVIIMKADGSVESFAEHSLVDITNRVMPNARPVRLSADTSQVFDYLRLQTHPQLRLQAQCMSDEGHANTPGVSARAHLERSAHMVAQPAFHGSPYAGIQAFSTEHIGRGEGAQSYGWGLYFTSTLEIAQFYRQKLTIEEKYVDGELLDPYEPMHYLALAISDASGDIREATDHLKLMVSHAGSQSIRTTAAAALRLLEQGHRQQITYVKPEGAVYEVDIPDDDQMLLWDAAVCEQPARIQQAVYQVVREVLDQGMLSAASRDLKRALQPYTRGDLLQEISARYGWKIQGQTLVKPDGAAIDNSAIEAQLSQRAGQKNYKDFGHVYRDMAAAMGSDAAVSEMLNAAGIKGIKYLDGHSRHAGEGTYNYVVFDGRDVALRQTSSEVTSEAPGADEDLQHRRQAMRA